MKCPGQDAENLRLFLHKCPDYDTGVEIFSNEMRTRCSTRMFRIGKSQVFAGISIRIERAGFSRYREAQPLSFSPRTTI